MTEFGLFVGGFTCGVLSSYAIYKLVWEKRVCEKIKLEFYKDQSLNDNSNIFLNNAKDALNN